MGFTCFSQITFRRGYKFVEFVLFVTAIIKTRETMADHDINCGY